MERTMTSQGARMIQLLKSVFLSYLVTAIMLLITALLMFTVHISGSMVSIAMIVTYILSAFVGGFSIGKRVGERRFLWGLIVAIVYFCVYILISVFVNYEQSVSIAEYIKSFLILIFSGMLGGMLS